MQSTVTLVGNVVKDVRVTETANGAVANFRIAADNSYYDRRQERWISRSTYVNVSAWRGLAANVATSVFKGQPVVVVGRPRQYEYERDGQTHTVIEVEADLVGHDLNRGSASFERVRRGPQTSDLLREVEAVARQRVEVPDTLPDEWAVPGIPRQQEIGTPPAA